MTLLFATPEDLRAAFAAARASGKRAKEAAESIGSNEGAAVAAHCGAHAYPPKAIALSGPWIDLLKALEPCGPLMGLTRNESTVHEKTGVYTKLSAMGQMGLALGEDIDLRLFFSQWHAGFAVTELAANPQNRPNVSLQFFDAHGLAVHKIFQRDATDRAAFDAVVQRFTSATSPAVPTPAPQPDAAIDVAGLGDAWAALQDTHEFFGMLKKFGAERQQSLRLVQGRFTHSLSTMAPRKLLQSASFDGVPIMVFVGSRGCIQIHTGPVKRIEPMDIRGVQWLNVIDPTFNLHLREDSIAHVWRVQKPTADGVVTSVEVFDHAGELMAMFFGARKPGQPELPSWRELVAGLPTLEPVPA
ncbi:ChuX/HutX family heme-like substrate-binding protein [Rhodoferax sp.]|uniref:hemin-degrading factor n=1 Tax=Rhodoferax sp. TaxID=50421 RepID=UPI0025F93867|nr:ChuX/HutX family heme-like substrate-binding protein [Rhodoferax sp.]